MKYKNLFFKKKDFKNGLKNKEYGRTELQFYHNFLKIRLSLRKIGNTIV